VLSLRCGPCAARISLTSSFYAVEFANVTHERAASGIESHHGAVKVEDEGSVREVTGLIR